MSKQEQLDHQTKQLCDSLAPIPKTGVLPTSGIDQEVTMVGGGQSGVATACGFRRAGMANVSIIDEAEEGREARK